MTCTAEGTAVVGQYENKGTAAGEYGTTTARDEDPNHYLVEAGPFIDIEKFVSVDDKVTWHDADSPTGPNAIVGSDVYFKFNVTNNGNVELTNIVLTDSDFDVNGCTLTDPFGSGRFI